MTSDIGLPDHALQAIQQVLASHPEVEEAVVYGSRALGRQRPASDIDLTLIGEAIDCGTLARIEAELDDLLLPWMIDLSRLADLSHPPLLAHIQQVGQVLYRRGNPNGSPSPAGINTLQRNGCQADGHQARARG